MLLLFVGYSNAVFMNSVICPRMKEILAKHLFNVLISAVIRGAVFLYDRFEFNRWIFVEQCFKYLTVRLIQIMIRVL